MRHVEARAVADPVETWQADVLAELRAIRHVLERQPRPSPLTRQDRATLAALLPAAGGVFGSEPFLTRDLFESDAAALRVVLRGLNVRSVGRVFRRAEGTPIDGYLIQREGSELNAIVWRILRA